MVLLSCCQIVEYHLPVDQRVESFDTHSRPGLYVGPILEIFGCIPIYNPHKKRFIITDTYSLIFDVVPDTIWNPIKENMLKEPIPDRPISHKSLVSRHVPEDAPVTPVDPFPLSTHDGSVIPIVYNAVMETGDKGLYIYVRLNARKNRNGVINSISIMLSGCLYRSMRTSFRLTWDSSMQIEKSIVLVLHVLKSVITSIATKQSQQFIKY